jgi:hypothetical protein
MPSNAESMSIRPVSQMVWKGWREQGKDLDLVLGKEAGSAGLNEFEFGVIRRLEVIPARDTHLTSVKIVLAPYSSLELERVTHQ